MHDLDAVGYIVRYMGYETFTDLTKGEESVVFWLNDILFVRVVYIDNKYFVTVESIDKILTIYSCKKISVVLKTLREIVAMDWEETILEIRECCEELIQSRMEEIKEGRRSHDSIYE